MSGKTLSVPCPGPVLLFESRGQRIGTLGEVTNLMASQPWNALNTVDYRNDEVENGLRQARQINRTWPGLPYKDVCASRRGSSAYGSCFDHSPDRMSAKHARKFSSSQRSIAPPATNLAGTINYIHNMPSICGGWRPHMMPGCRMRKRSA
jgi:hypothetical protein